MKTYITVLLFILFLSGISFGKISKSATENDYPQGRWETKTEWKVKLIKDWVAKKVYVPYWKKVWTPVEVREWIPYPSPPPGWSR